LLRWRIKLEEYDYEMVHKKGDLNTNADALSRIQELSIESKPNFGKEIDDETKKITVRVSRCAYGRTSLYEQDL
jgi:hypothetical protein